MKQRENDLVTYTCPDCKKSRVCKWRHGRPYGGERLCSGCGVGRAKRVNDWSRTHDGTKTPLYKVWHAMLQRCDNPNDQSYKRYGGRGIRVCAEWYKFEIFRDWALSNGYASGLYLDRRDNDYDYTQPNCRWVTSAESGVNRSSTKLTTSSVVVIRELIKAGVMCKDIASKFGVNPRTISGIKHGRKWAWLP